MTDLSNYYQRDHRDSENASSHRFPRNHLEFSALLKPLNKMITIFFGLMLISSYPKGCVLFQISQQPLILR
jgi:hypothetical protein